MHVCRLPRRAPIPGVAAALALVLMTALVTSCSSSSNSSTTGTQPTAAATSTTADRACTPNPAYTPGTNTHQLPVAGATREFLVHVPPTVSTRVPLVVDFHGAGSNMVEQDVYGDFDPLADAKGFIVATPNGIDAAIRQWRFLGTQDDVNFANAIVDELVAHACVDPQRVYASGISSGSAMTASLACQSSTRFHGFGLVAGDFYSDSICGSAKPRPMVVFHGTADPVVPYNGGQIAGGTIPVAPEEQTVQSWAQHSGCSGAPTQTTLSSEVVRISYTGCDQPVVLYKIIGGGHTWPGANIDVARLGTTTKQIDATQTMWDFWTAKH
jgi:polyhydroxybutyrate depolymerase